MSELNGGFKFTAQPYWPDGSNGGLDYGYDYFTSKEGMTNDGGNLSLPQGIYYIVVNLDDKYIYGYYRYSHRRMGKRQRINL